MERIRRKPLPEALVVALMFAFFGAVMLAIGWRMTAPTAGRDRLLEANPDWDFDRIGARAHERKSGASVIVPIVFEGQRRLTLAACNGAPFPLPAWWSTPQPVEPPTCAKLEGEGETVWLVDSRVRPDVPEVWADHLSPLVEASGWAGSGDSREASAEPDFVRGVEVNRSPLAPAPPGEIPRRIACEGTWWVQAPTRGEAPEIRIDAFRYGELTQLAVAFVRPLERPARP